MSEDNNQPLFPELGDDLSKTLEHVDAFNDVELKHIYSRRLVEFYELHSHVLEQLGITGEQNNKISMALVTSIGNYFGGVSFYLPHNEKLKTFLRDIEIYNAFNGENISALARKHRVSQQTIYNAVARQRDVRQKKLEF